MRVIDDKKILKFFVNVFGEIGIKIHKEISSSFAQESIHRDQNPVESVCYEGDQQIQSYNINNGCEQSINCPLKGSHRVGLWILSKHDLETFTKDEKL